MLTSSHNACGDCNACCDRPSIVDLTIKPPFQKPRGALCNNWCNGCTIYKQRPQPCRDFECFWLKINSMGKNFPEELRPDNLGIMVSSDRIDGVGCIIIDELEEGIFDISNLSQNQSVMLNEIVALIDNQSEPIELILRSHNWDTIPINIHRNRSGVTEQ